MSLVIDEAYLPATLTASPMTDEEFVEFCAKFPDYFIEMSAEGEVLIMPPGDFLTSSQVGENLWPTPRLVANTRAWMGDRVLWRLRPPQRRPPRSRCRLVPG